MSTTIRHLTAKPNARLTQLLLAADGALTVQLKAPAHAGRANTELVAFLAAVFGLAKPGVTSTTGHTAPFKQVRLGGLSAEDCQQVLARYRTHRNDRVTVGSLIYLRLAPAEMAAAGASLPIKRKQSLVVGPDGWPT